ncbi:hypothetical protein D6C89_04104 [Aureobasidium pullulans]|uniref:Amidohydrolase-related domain-containing protein n=1 Tax=Aureobasidium pullulans TaxID=5580 RepID=A0A4S8VRZ2_AURPU|nr:hypothetical protein D6D24_05326 [Aureobasidium pullulans]THZ25920.1 hypothetical protein D6C89_04104 [Aureobasidium pullulans]
MSEKGAILTLALVTNAEMNEWPGYLPPESAKKNSAVLEAGIRSLKIASEAGVTICFGTDLLGPLCPDTRVQHTLGIPFPGGPASYGNGQSCTLGQIKPGFVADLLILESNPLEDITILDSPDKYLFAVMKEGRVYHSRWSKLPVDAPTPVSLIQ